MRRRHLHLADPRQLFMISRDQVGRWPGCRQACAPGGSSADEHDARFVRLRHEAFGSSAALQRAPEQHDAGDDGNDRASTGVQRLREEARVGAHDEAVPRLPRARGAQEVGGHHRRDQTRRRAARRTPRRRPSRPNCLKYCPAMPPMKLTGAKIAMMVRVMAMTARPISSAASIDGLVGRFAHAACGARCSRSRRSHRRPGCRSTSVMAEQADEVEREAHHAHRPEGGIADSGSATATMIVARQSRRKMNTTMTASTRAFDHRLHGGR